MTYGSRLFRSPWFWLALGLAAVLVRGLFLDAMDVDASQYASISMEMLQNGSWLQVKHHGGDYLDKPPLLFWMSAASFGLFGLSNWAYKLPSLFVALAGVYAVYRFSILYYSKKTAGYAAIILASSVGLIVICNDVRTDTLLLGMSACAVWQLAEYLRFNRWLNLIYAFVFIGLAMLAKGPIGLVMPAFATGAHLLLRRDWRNIFRWQWLVGLGVAGLVLIPMCWGLYQQFDLHPEKTVNDRTGVSGLYFFFWEQSFGRITGENAWKNDTSPFYFLHVYLWAFLPWPLLLIGALWQRLRDVFRQGLRIPDGEEAFSLGGFVLTFIALSLSKYKLPHYIFITLPWAAILTARWIGTIKPEHLKRLFGLQYFVFAVLLSAVLLIPGFVFPTLNPVWWGILLLMIALWLRTIFRRPFPENRDALVQRSVWLSVTVALVLNFYFYPKLLPFQSTSAMMQRAKQAGIPAENITFFRRHGHALDFYNGHLLEDLKSPDSIRQAAFDPGGLWVYTNKEGKAELDTARISYTVADSLQHFQVALLKPKFLNPATRPQTLEAVFLLKILPNQNQ